MPFLEKQRHGNGTYYYLVKSVRTSPARVRKFRLFLGREIPPKEQLADHVRKLERRALRTFRPRWIGRDTLERLDDLQAAVAVYRTIPGEAIPKDFLVRFTYNTNAIEGNPLTLRQTTLLLLDGVTPQGARAEHAIEALNSRDAWAYVQKFKGSLGKAYACKVQYLVTKDTSCRIQGEYRDSEVRIDGSTWSPPPPRAVPKEMDEMFRRFPRLRATHHPVELATTLHNRLVQIHPFTDGNGRTARLLMNWALMKGRFPPAIIEAKNKEAYYGAIERADAGDNAPFARFLSAQLLEQYSQSISPKDG